MNDTEIHKYLSNILNSKAFSHSDVNKRLLKYLTESTSKGEKPKEFTIGVDLFNQKADSPVTSRVRVSIHNLRKKLESYYKNEGARDAIIFSIPKGTYTLEFKPRKDLQSKNRFIKIGYIIPASMILVMMSLIFILPFKPDSYKLTKNKFWNDIVNNQKETVIVVGDAFLFSENTLSDKYGADCIIGSELINTEQDLQQFFYQNDSLDPRDFQVQKNVSFVSSATLQCMSNIVPLLDRNDVRYKTIPSSSFRWETFSDHNILYIGELKNMKLLSFLTESKLNIKNDPANNSFSLSDTNGVRNYVSVYENNISIDYALVSKIPGPSNNVFYLFTSNHETGYRESVKLFTQLDSVICIEKNILQNADYFLAVFKAEGVERVNVSFNLVEYTTITDSALTNFWHY